MSKYESSIKELAYPQHSVYAKLSDLSNLANVKERMDDPGIGERLGGQVSEEQLRQVKEKLESLEVTSDEISIDVPPVGRLALRIVERTPDKCIKFESVQSPVPLKFWVQVVPDGEARSKMRLTVDASINPFLRVMVEKPLKQGLEKLADMLAMLPYDAPSAENPQIELDA